MALGEPLGLKVETAQCMHLVDLILRQRNMVPDGNGGEDRCSGPVVPEKNLWHQMEWFCHKWGPAEKKPVASDLNYEEEKLGHVARLDPANDTRHALATPTLSQWKRPPRRPRNSWLSVVSKDMKGVGILGAIVMAEDRMRWKRVVAEHAMPQEGTLPECGSGMARLNCVRYIWFDNSIAW